jgi:hypothetical protein
MTANLYVFGMNFLNKLFIYNYYNLIVPYLYEKEKGFVPINFP